MISHSPEDFARAVLDHLASDQIENEEMLAGRLGLTIREVNSTNFEGALVRIPQTAGGIIAVKRGIREPGRRRFTITHEIGHFVLPGHGQDERYCKSAAIESWRRDVIKRQEYEANKFASELLLPAKKLYPLVNANQLTLARIKDFAAQFHLALTATAVKCIEVTEEKCALVCSIRRDVKWVCKSDSFNYYVPPARLGLETLAGRVFESAGSIRELQGEIFASAWISENNIPPNEKLWEEAIAMPYYETVLSLLTA
jgi:hypothetical protein